MPRRLTLEEAASVTQLAREDGSRPELYRSTEGTETEIGRDFEAYLILTPTSTLNSMSSFFQVVLDNDPNQVELRDQLLSEFLEEEGRNESENQRMFQEITELYDQTRENLASSLEGFDDVEEAALLQEAFTRSMGDIVSARDRHIFNSSAISVLQARKDAGGSADLRQELQSWVRVLLEYE